MAVWFLMDLQMRRLGHMWFGHFTVSHPLFTLVFFFFLKKLLFTAYFSSLFSSISCPKIIEPCQAAVENSLAHLRGFISSRTHANWVISVRKGCMALAFKRLIIIQLLLVASSSFDTDVCSSQVGLGSCYVIIKGLSQYMKLLGISNVNILHDQSNTCATSMVSSLHA